MIKEISAAETKHSKTDEDFFTIRELDVLQLTAQELSSTEIANQLHISPRTVEQHKKNMKAKTKAKNFIGVIKYALINGHLKLK
ncbi:MAG: LuxR C-terminal-related transcriptional regulator [Psychroflexus maritimus]